MPAHTLSKLTPLAKALMMSTFIRPRLSLTALGLTLSVTVAAQAQQWSLNIPAQPLDRALQTLADQTRIQVLYSPTDVQNMRSSALKGAYTLEDSIKTLLNGTGIAYQLNGNTLTLHPPSSGELELSPLAITGQGVGETTEQTGSYTIKAMGTATKLPLSIRETPQSVSVVTRKQIEDQNLTDIASVLERSTGVTLSKSESDRHYIYARGFAITKIQYDGIPARDNGFGYETDLLSDTSIYDHIEIVRGATGLMSGSGEPSAAINLVRKRPTRDVQGHAQISAGRWDSYRSELDVSGPLSHDGNVRGRFVGTYADGNSNMDYRSKDTTGLYGVLEGDLTEDTLLTVGIDYQNSHTNGVTYGAPVPLYFSNGQRTHFSRSTTTAADWTSLDKEKSVFFTSLEHTLNEHWKGKLQYTHREVEASPTLLYVSGAPNITTGQGISAFSTSYDINTKQDAIDLYTTGFFPVFGREHELVLGYSYNEYSAVYKWHPLLSSTAAGSFYNWNYPTPVFGEGHNRKRDSTWRETSTYATARWNLSDSLKLITGLRVTDADFDESFTTNTSTRFSSELTPYAGLIYDLNENHSLYVSYTDIFQTQSNRDRNGTLLDPITGTNYEAGLKSEFFEGGLNFSAAVFKVKQDNLAEFDIVVGGENRYRAIQGATVRGYELEVSGNLTPDWNLASGFTRRIAKQESGASIQTIEPQNLFRLTTSYRLPGDLSAITLGGHATWQSRTYEKNTRPGGGDSVQDSYELIHLFGIYKATDHLSFQANLNNVFDKKYYSGIINGYGFYGEPRNLNVAMKYNF